MASSTCHVVCVPKRLRLERLVRPPRAELAPGLATAQPLRRTLQQVLPIGLRLAYVGVEARTSDSCGQELSLRPFRSRLGQSNLAESRTCPKPSCCRADCRCLHRACEVQTLRISETLQIAWNPATTVRETRPNAKYTPKLGRYCLVYRFTTRKQPGNPYRPTIAGMPNPL